MKKLNYIIISLLITLVIGCTNKKKEIVTTEVIADNTTKEQFYPELGSTRYNVALLIMNGAFNQIYSSFLYFLATKFKKNIKAMNVFTVANTL